MDEDDFDLKELVHGSFRVQTQLLLAKIRDAETWFYTGTPYPWEARRVGGFLSVLKDGDWLLFTECNKQREEVLQILNAMPGKRYTGWRIEQVIHPFIVEDVVINVEDSKWAKMRNVVEQDGLHAEEFIQPTDHWLEYAEIFTTKRDAKKKINVLIFGLNSFQAILLLGIHRIFPKHIVAHA